MSFHHNRVVALGAAVVMRIGARGCLGPWESYAPGGIVCSKRSGKRRAVNSSLWLHPPSLICTSVRAHSEKGNAMPPGQ
eukprot:10159-Eustigmatos_ZCMA.PRE.1